MSSEHENDQFSLKKIQNEIRKFVTKKALQLNDVPTKMMRQSSNYFSKYFN